MAFALALAASAYLVIAVYVFASRKPGYSHIRHTISELGEHDAIDSRVVSYGVFLPVGVLLLGVAGLTVSAHPAHAMLAFSIAVGYLVAAAFPCDPGSPVVGSMRQAVHNIGGAIQYLGGAASLMWISQLSGNGFQIAAIVVLAAALVLSFENRIRGINQRIAETILFAGLCYALWTM